MSSSQGPNNITSGPPYPIGTTPGYAFNRAIIRDGSDWTRYVRETRTLENYIVTSPDNKTPLPWWDRYGNQFRLNYFTGLLKCAGPLGLCGGGAYNGGPVGSFPPAGPT